jgi:RNA polymerase sigma-70 factor (ECF subfamily)
MMFPDGPCSPLRALSAPRRSLETARVDPKSKFSTLGAKDSAAGEHPERETGRIAVPATLPLNHQRAPLPQGVDDPAVALDLALADRLARGDKSAAEDLVEEHLDPLYAFVHYRVGRDRARAEDLVQDTLVTAFERIASFDGRSSLQVWLCGIARNKIRSDRRKRAPVALEDVLADSEGEIDAILCDVARERLPDEVLEREETRDLVGATLSSLPPEYRRALLEKYVDGLSVVEMSSRSRKSPKATESTLTRARTAFARVFELLAKKRGGLD